MVFDKNWEDNIYSEQSQVNRYPFDWVVSTVNRLFPKINNSPNMNALELGCGTGNNLKFLLDFGFQDVHGIDGSVSALKIADKYLDNTDNKLKLILADFTSLPEESDNFDLVLDRGSITHNDFKSCRNILSETLRVLKPGGFFISAIFSSSHSRVQKDQLISRSYYHAFQNETATNEGLKTSFFNMKDILELFAPFEIRSCILNSQEEMISDPSRISMWYIIAQKVLDDKKTAADQQV
jgi:ubiquinone/menaquinone biosynthesis C-methylase UbiE